MNKQRGLFSIEAIASIMVSVPCLLAVTLYISKTSKDYLILNREKQQVFNANKTQQILDKAAQELDHHTFVLYPRIHKAGKITYADGRINSITTSKDKLPDPESDALTYSSLNLLGAQRVVRRTFANDLWQFHTCSRYGNFFKRDEYKSFALIAGDKIFEATGKALQSGNEGSVFCYDFELRPELSSLLELPEQRHIQFTQYILPIENLYTIYVDKKLRLRYLGHEGPRNIENQPLLENFGQLQLVRTAFSDNKLTHITASLTAPKTIKTLNFGVNNHLGRTSPLNFILNSP